MDLDPTLAHTLEAVIDEGTLEAAAARLHLTPSAVSQRLKSLENHLGRRLLVRSLPVRATAAGESVVHFSRQMSLLEAETSAALGLASEGMSARLSVAVNADSLATWFLPAVADFAREHEGQVEILRADQDETAHLLEDGAAIAAVTSSATPPGGCSCRSLGALEYRAVASPAWYERWFDEAAPPGTGRLQEVLARAPRLDFDRSDELQKRFLTSIGVDPHDAPRHLVPASKDFWAAVELGIGWGMLPLQQIEATRRREPLVELGGVPVRTPLYWQSWRARPQLLEALTQQVVDRAHAVLEQDTATPEA